MVDVWFGLLNIGIVDASRLGFWASFRFVSPLPTIHHPPFPFPPSHPLLLPPTHHPHPTHTNHSIPVQPTHSPPPSPLGGKVQVDKTQRSPQRSQKSSHTQNLVCLSSLSLSLSSPNPHLYSVPPPFPQKSIPAKTQPQPNLLTLFIHSFTHNITTIMNGIISVWKKKGGDGVKMKGGGMGWNGVSGGWVGEWDRGIEG